MSATPLLVLWEPYRGGMVNAEVPTLVAGREVKPLAEVGLGDIAAEWAHRGAQLSPDDVDIPEPRMVPHGPPVAPLAVLFDSLVKRQGLVSPDTPALIAGDTVKPVGLATLADFRVDVEYMEMGAEIATVAAETLRELLTEGNYVAVHQFLAGRS